MKKKFICERCRGSEISWDATAVWDVNEQRMELGSAFQDCSCDQCGSTSIVETAALEEDLTDIQIKPAAITLESLKADIFAIAFRSGEQAEKYRLENGGSVLEGETVAVWFAPE